MEEAKAYLILTIQSFEVVEMMHAKLSYRQTRHYHLSKSSDQSREAPQRKYYCQE